MRERSRENLTWNRGGRLGARDQALEGGEKRAKEGWSGGRPNRGKEKAFQTGWINISILIL